MSAQLDDICAPSRMPIRQWAKNERPRERFLEMGPASLSDEQLLALFLRTGVRGLSAIDLARSLIEEFGSLRALLDASAGSLRKMHGIGDARPATLLAVSELVRRALTEKARQRDSLKTPGAVEDLLRMKLGTVQREVFLALYMDSSNALIEMRDEAQGTLTRVPVFPQEIVRRALEIHAAGVIVAHNHPAGGADPSASDRRLTTLLRDALDLIDVKLLDHFIVAQNDLFSFARMGLM